MLLHTQHNGRGWKEVVGDVGGQGWGGGWVRSQDMALLLWHVAIPQKDNDKDSGSNITSSQDDVRYTGKHRSKLSLTFFNANIYGKHIFLKCTHTHTQLEAHTWQAWAICKALAKKGNRKLSRWRTAPRGAGSSAELEGASFKFPFSPRYPTDTSIAPRSTLKTQEKLGKSVPTTNNQGWLPWENYIFPGKALNPKTFSVGSGNSVWLMLGWVVLGGTAISSGPFVPHVCVCVLFGLVCVPLYILFCRCCLITKFSILSHKNICKTSSNDEAANKQAGKGGSGKWEECKKRKILLCILIHFMLRLLVVLSSKSVFSPLFQNPCSKNKIQKNNLSH